MSLTQELAKYRQGARNRIPEKENIQLSKICVNLLTIRPMVSNPSHIATIGILETSCY